MTLIVTGIVISIINLLCRLSLSWNIRWSRSCKNTNRLSKACFSYLCRIL